MYLVLKFRVILDLEYYAVSTLLIIFRVFVAANRFALTKPASMG